MPQAWSGNRIEQKGIGVSEGGGALKQGIKRREVGAVELGGWSRERFPRPCSEVSNGGNWSAARTAPEEQKGPGGPKGED